jgi:dihydroflavonol-4-reductase
MKPVVVTGATGLLGSNLVVALVQRGFRVRALRRSPSSAPHLAQLGADWHDAALSDPASLVRVFDGAAAVFHCAGSVVQSRRVRPEHLTSNVEATGNVVAAASAAKVDRLVHCSSTVACAIATDGGLADETRPWNFPECGLADGYAWSKRQAEQAVSNAAGALDAVIVNPGFMFGPMDHRPSSGQLILEVAAGRTSGWTSGANNFVDVRDVANGMISALERGRRGERYILGGQNLSYRQILTVVADAVGVRPPSFAVPRAVAVVAGLAGDLAERVTGAPTRLNTATVRYAYCAGMRFSSAKAARELGYRHGPVKTAIEDAVAWLRAARMLRVPPPVNTPQN